MLIALRLAEAQAEFKTAVALDRCDAHALHRAGL